MPEGQCTSCGAKYFGWHLETKITPCEECGGVVQLLKGEYLWAKKQAS